MYDDSTLELNLFIDTRFVSNRDKCRVSLQHYAELPDIKRVIVNTHAIEPQVLTHLVIVSISNHYYCWTRVDFFAWLQALVEFFGTLSREWALECMKDLLLVNLRGNLQIIVQVFISSQFFCFVCRITDPSFFFSIA